jgi:pSer/pThr/pTyr-binding forkhead associated (FHA) protein
MLAATEGRVTAKLDLVCLEGPLQGERFELVPTGRILFGRSKRGIHLPDPQVSLEHAEVTFAANKFFVADLGSVSGTFVNEKRIGREATALVNGSTVAIGESVFRVEERQESRLWLIPVSTVAVLVGAVGAYGAWQLAIPITYDPALVWSAPVHQAGGVVDAVVKVPLAFVRAEGIDQTGLSIRRVTDYDADGIDELWLLAADKEFVVTFDETGWDVIGRLPLGCIDHPGGVFPDLRCGTGETWTNLTGGAYAQTGGDGMTVWVDWTPIATDPKAPPPPKPAGPTAFRVGIVDPETLGGFLALRGIEERIQYLICEEAVPGITAQVLTASGRIRPLGYGCIRELRLTGDGELAGEIPLAVAFTAPARQALLDDLREFLSGSPDGLFLDEPGLSRIEAMAGNPIQRLVMRTSFTGVNVPGNPIAPEKPINGRRSLLPSSLGHAAPHAEVVTITDPVTKIDPPGCADLEVDVTNWYCVMTQLCMPNQTAVEVKELGCDVPGGASTIVTAPYTGGVHMGGDGNVEVRAALDSHGGSGRVDVLRTRIGWREMPKP